jgi:hypothetical protein
MRSRQFPELILSVEQVLSPPVVEDLIREEQAEKQQLEQKNERMAAKLREMGIDPDAI